MVAVGHFIDAALGVVAPRAALKRRLARASLSALDERTGRGYRGGRDRASRKTPRPRQGGSANLDTLPDLETLREQSRDAVRNNPLARSPYDQFLYNVVGPQLRMVPVIDRRYLGLSEEEADEIESKIAACWKVWCRECDITKRLSFAALTRQALGSALESGDVFAILPRKQRPGHLLSLKIEIIEADRIINPVPSKKKGIRTRLGIDRTDNTPLVRGGIEFDGDGAPLRIHLATHHPGDRGQVFLTTHPVNFVGPGGDLNVVHLVELKRPGQVRGVPYFATILRSLELLQEFTDAELDAAVVQAMMTVFVKTPGEDANSILSTKDDDPDPEPEEREDGDITLGPAAVVELLPGEDVEMVDPKRPNSAFEPFFNSVVKQIAIGVGLPYEVLTKAFNSSYSAARAALVDAWTTYLNMRAWLIEGWCDPIRHSFLDELVAREIIPAPGYWEDPLIKEAYRGVMWVGPTQPQIDPVKEVTAAEKRLDNNLTTRQSEASQLSGQDWEKHVLPQIKKEKTMMADMADEEEVNNVDPP